MHTLAIEDRKDLVRSISKFKIIVPLAEIESACDTEILKMLFDNMLDLALRYTESVCCFQRIVIKYEGQFDEAGERQAIEDVRGSIHVAFMTSVNVLCRMMLRVGKSVEWRNRIGEDRTSLGRFALTLSFEYIRTQGGAK